MMIKLDSEVFKEEKLSALDTLTSPGKTSAWRHSYLYIHLTGGAFSVTSFRKAVIIILIFGQIVKNVIVFDRACFQRGKVSAGFGVSINIVSALCACPTPTIVAAAWPRGRVL